ncbi:MAG: carbohydrate ABC transporter substrate-binding protein, partial [Burkholderiaceae bacterium]
MATTSRNGVVRSCAGVALALAALASASAQPPRAEVIHWWTARGESAAVRELANAYETAGGAWVDAAI